MDQMTLARLLLGNPARSAVTPPRTQPDGRPSLRSYDPSLRDRLGDVISDTAEMLGLGGQAQRMRTEGTFGADFLPGVGEALGIDDTSRALDAGNYGQAALAGGALAMGAIPMAGDMLGQGLKKAAPMVDEVAEILGGPWRQSVDGTVGMLDNPGVLFEGVSPHDFQPEQWGRFGDQYGVPNLGPRSNAEFEASLVPYTSTSGRQFTVPGGIESQEPFSYYDLLHLKQQGINPNDMPPEMHQAIHDRMLRTMSPEGEVSPERLMNQLMLAQISPNQPLSPNELAVARSMVKGPEDLDRLGAMIPWNYADDPSTIDRDFRMEKSAEIADMLGLGAGSRGGLGARGTADYTRIAETAQRLKADPDFFRFRGEGEGGATSAENWANFVERLSNQTPGLSSKTGSFGAVWQNPAEANISAVDRHMAGKFNEEMFPSPDEFASFKQRSVERWNKANPDAPVDSYDRLTQGFKNDQIFGYLNNNPGMKYRGKPAKGSNSGLGEVNPRVPAHLQPDQARWVNEPESIELISDPYRRVLDANAQAANEAGQSIFGSQWMLWDRIRNRLEPHEIMFPGLEKLPRMSMDQMRTVRDDLSKAGYMSGSKIIDEATGQPMLTPARPLPSASRAAYFSLPLALMLGGGAAALRDPQDEPGTWRPGEL